MTHVPAGQREDLAHLLTSDRYRIEATLGCGAMATVYRAFDRQTETWVAIKVLNEKYLRKPKIRRRFELEAMALERLEHRNIVTVLDACFDSNPPFLVMELAEGGCLMDWIGLNGPLPPRMAVDAVIQICKGVSMAHVAGIIHRDIKPENVLMNRRGVCQLTDFGIAQMRNTSTSLTITGQAMGTLGYVAPEQLNDARHVDIRADVYSIGATLFTMLAGFTAQNLFLASRGKPSLLEPIPELLRPIVQRATNYDPHLRYANPDALAKALHDLRPMLPATPMETPSLALRAEETMEVPKKPNAPNTYDGPGATPRPMGFAAHTGSGHETHAPPAGFANWVVWIGIVALALQMLSLGLTPLLQMTEPNPVFLAAEQAWYGSLAEQVGIIEDLGALGADEPALERAYRTQASATDPKVRRAAAVAYMALLESEAALHTQNVTFEARRKAQAIEIRLDVLRQAQDLQHGVPRELGRATGIR